MTNFDRLALLLKERRLELALSQKDISEMSGVALRTINALETGKASINLKNLSVVADVLGLELTFILKKMEEGDETDM